MSSINFVTALIKVPKIMLQRNFGEEKLLYHNEIKYFIRDYFKNINIASSSYPQVEKSNFATNLSDENLGFSKFPAISYIATYSDITLHKNYFINLLNQFEIILNQIIFSEAVLNIYSEYGSLEEEPIKIIWKAENLYYNPFNKSDKFTRKIIDNQKNLLFDISDLN